MSDEGRGMSDNAKLTILVALIGAAGAIGAALIPLLLADRNPPPVLAAATIAAPPATVETPAPVAPAPAGKAAGKSAPGKSAVPPALNKAAVRAAVAADEARVQGGWAVVAQQARSKAFRDEDLGESRPTWTFRGDGLTIRHRVDGQVVVQNEGTFKFRRSNGRKTLDFTGDAPDGRPIAFYGIYDFEDEILKVCFLIHRGPADSAPERPDAFAAGPGRVDLRLKRIAD